MRTALSLPSLKMGNLNLGINTGAFTLNENMLLLEAGCFAATIFNLMCYRLLFDGRRVGVWDDY